MSAAPAPRSNGRLRREGAAPDEESPAERVAALDRRGRAPYRPGPSRRRGSRCPLLNFARSRGRCCRFPTRPAWSRSPRRWPRAASRSSPPAAPPRRCAEAGLAGDATSPRSPAFPRCWTGASRRCIRGPWRHLAGAAMPSMSRRWRRTASRRSTCWWSISIPSPRPWRAARLRRVHREHRHRRPGADPRRGEEPRRRRRGHRSRRVRRAAGGAGAHDGAHDAGAAPPAGRPRLCPHRRL